LQAASSTAGVAELLPSTEEAASALKEATVLDVPTSTRMATAVGSRAATAAGGTGVVHGVINPLFAVGADETGKRERAGTGGMFHVRGGTAEKKEEANEKAVPPTEMSDADEATSSKHVV
jgi:hypothetical protein